MSFMKRLSVTLRSQLDEAVSRIENHDAVIDAALQESRDAIARLKVEQSRMRKKIDSIDTQLEKQQVEEQNWIRRAKALGRKDEAQALACLERRDRCVAQIEQLKGQREQTLEMEFRLGNNLSELEQKLLSDEQRLQEFRGRDLSVKAVSAMQEAMGSESASVEQAFGRWELDITRKELRKEAVAPQSAAIDTLDERFQREERMQARRAELKALMEDAS